MKKNAHATSGRSTRLITLATLLLLVYTVVGFLVVPLLIRKVGASLVERRLNGTVTMERASFNPYTFQVTIDGLEVTDPDGARVAAVDHFDGNLQLFSSIFRPGWRFHHVLVMRPFGRGFIDQDGELNLAELIAPLLDGSGEPLREIPRLIVNELAVVEARLEFRDETPPVPFDRVVEDLTFRLEHLDTAPTNENPLRLAGTMDSGGTFLWEGSFFADPLSSTGRLAVSGIDLSRLMPYAMPYTEARLTSGTMGVDLGYTFAAPRTERPATATVNVRQLTLDAIRVERDNAPILDAPKIEVTGVTGDAFARSLNVEQVAIGRPTLAVRRNDEGVLELQSLLTQTPWQEEDDPDAGESAPRVDPTSIEYPIMQVIATIEQLLVDAFGPWTVQLDQVAVVDATAEFTDASRAEPVVVNLAAFGLEAGPVGSDDGYRAPYALRTNVGDGGRLEARGEAALGDRVVTANVVASGIRLAPLSPYLPQTLPEPLPRVRTADATVGLDGEWRAEEHADGTISTGWTGRTTLDGVSLRDEDGVERLATGQIALDGFLELELTPNIEHLEWQGTAVVADARIDAPLRGPVRGTAGRLSVDGRLELSLPPGGEIGVEYIGAAGLGEVSLDAPELFESRVLIRDGSATGVAFDYAERTIAADEVIARGPDLRAVADFLAAASAPAEGSPAPKRSIELPYLVRVGHLLVEDAAVELRDASADPPFALSAGDARVEISGLVTDGKTPAEFSVLSSVHSGQIRVGGTTDLFRASPFANIEVQVSALPLKQHEPFVEKYLGYRVERGRLSASIPLTVEDDTVNGEIEFTFDSFHLGGKVDSPDAPSAPIKLGLDLLRDPNDRITGTIPISGDMNDPSFSITGLIGQAFVNMFTNVATAPFKLLGGLFAGAEDVDLSQVAFAAGDARLDAGAVSTLDMLARALNERPALTLAAVGRFAAADEAALRPALLREQLMGPPRAGEPLVYSLSNPDYGMAVRAAYREAFEVPDGTDPPPTDVMNAALLERIDVPPALLADLAQRRVAEVIRVLVEENGVAAERVTGEEPEDPMAETPAVVFELG